MKIIAACFLSLFAAGLAFADIIPMGKRVADNVVMVDGLTEEGKTEDGSMLVLVVDSVQGQRTVTQVLNNTPIDRGYKFNHAELYFVSADLLRKVHNNISSIDYTKQQKGLGQPPITVPSQWLVNENSHLLGRTTTYQLQ
ncbi:MAG: hypothetical protein EPN21_16195 [Methylococcaceae bacterium]|nr:MAG: hypothetical protein EPN21_16195 [Methylococcaceae bacterium]